MKTRNLTEQQELKSIERVALSTKYSAEQIDNLIEIASATPNPTLAIEIMLDIYVEPTVKPFALLNDDPNREVTAVRYDKWTDKVWYEYTKPDSVDVRIDKDTDTSLITIENYGDFQVDYKHNNSTWHQVLTGKTKTVTDSTSLNNYRKMEQDYSKWFQLTDAIAPVKPRGPIDYTMD
jgi:hypothetical protein